MRVLVQYSVLTITFFCKPKKIKRCDVKVWKCDIKRTSLFVAQNTICWLWDKELGMNSHGGKSHVNGLNIPFQVVYKIDFNNERICFLKSHY